MLNSIKSQVLFLLFCVFTLLGIQAFYSYNSKAILNESLQISEEALNDVRVVLELERDVVDLQRNVLIFRDSGSQSAVSRFNNLVGSINEKITFLRDSDWFAQQLENISMLLRMERHINDYKENFESVIASQVRISDILDNQLLNDIATLNNDFFASAILSSSNSARGGLSLASAERQIISYILSPDAEVAEEFKRDMARLKVLVTKSTDIELRNRILLDIDKLSKDFLLLTQLTNANLYLINVVMAGSANEFLYLTGELTEQASRANAISIQLAIQQGETAKRNNDLISIIVLSLILLLAILLITRVILPITALTDVFRRIAAGNSDVKTPALARKDEVGDLAKAADVFKQTSLQTKELLDEAQTLNTQLEVARNVAEQATASKSIFLANMSHEIRTPLNGIVGLVDLARKEMLNEKVDGYLQKVTFSSQILMSVINDILDFSKIEAGKLDIETTSFSLHSLFENVLAIVAIRAQEKNLQVRFYVDPTLPSQCVGDPLRITQILLNICNNAVKFTARGSINIKITYQKNDAGNELTLFSLIQDTGIGMSEKQLENVFQPFTQADGSTNRKYGGTGLGLAIVKQLTELMGGHIYASSEPDVGSSFNVSFKVRAFKGQSGLFDNLSLTDHKIFLYQENQVVPSDYCVNSFIKASEFDLNALPVDCSDEKPDAVVIGMDSLENAESYLRRLKPFQDNNVPIGIVLTKPAHSQLLRMTNELQAVVLNHPFTPRQWQEFVCTLNNVPVPLTEAELKDNDAPLQGHILLVEDNAINQLVTGEMLESFGLTYDVAEDGEQAINKVANAPIYDLILMDVQMPVMDGYLATQELRAMGFKQLPIVGLSANAMREDEKKAKDAGMDNYVTKPIKRDTLNSTLCQYLT